MVLQAINPVLESTLGRIRDLEDREAARMSRAMEQTPEPEHPTPQRHAGAPQSSGQVQPLHANEPGHVPPCPGASLPSPVRQVSAAAESCAAAPHSVRQRQVTSGVIAPEAVAKPLADAPLS